MSTPDTTPYTLRDAAIERSHLIDDYEAVRTKALRCTKRANDLMSDLHHAIENGRTDAALDLLERIDTANHEALETLRKDPSRTT